MGNRIKEIRTVAGLTQQEFADKMGGDNVKPQWSKQRVERLENGKTKLDEKTAAHIAKIMGVSVGSVFEKGEDDTKRRLLDTFDLMTPEQQKMFLNMAEALPKGTQSEGEPAIVKATETSKKKSR